MASSNWLPFFCLLLGGGIVGFAGFILFPIWAAFYAHARGHTFWAIATIIAILLGWGPVLGLIAVLLSHNSPRIRQPTPSDYASIPRYPSGAIHYGTRIDSPTAASSSYTSSSYSSSSSSDDYGGGEAWKERLERMHDEDEEREREKDQERHDREEREAEAWAAEERDKQAEADDYRAQEDEKWQRIEDERQERLYNKFYSSDDDE